MTRAPSGDLAGSVHRLPVRVYYEDTDAAGIVYYASWLRFLERGRTEMLRLLGQQHSALRVDRGIHWVVRRCAIDYLKPARLDDELIVLTRCGQLGGASLQMMQEVRRDQAVLVEADLRVACMASDGRPARLPPEVRAVLSTVAAPVAPRSRHIPR